MKIIDYLQKEELGLYAGGPGSGRKKGSGRGKSSTVSVSEKGFGKTSCCGAEVAIDQDSGAPYCKKCYNEVEMIPK